MSQLLAGTSNWTASQVLSDVGAVPSNLALAVRADGRITVAWQGARSGTAQIYATSFDVIRSAWSAPAPVGDGSAAQQRPAVAVSTTETAIA